MIIQMPLTFAEKIGKENSDWLVQTFNQVSDDAKLRSIEILEEKFEKRLAQVEKEIIKWVFIFGVGEVTVIITVILSVMFVFFKR